MKKLIVSFALASMASLAGAKLVRLVPEHGISKAFTLKTDSDAEYVVRFYRPDVFRVEAAPKLWEGEGTNRTYKLDFTADDESDASKSAKGVWKNVEFVAD